MANDMAHMQVGPEGYTHFWTKAGAHTAYPANWSGTVKRAVLLDAIAAGKGEDMDAVAELKPRRVKIQDTPQLASELDASDGA